MSDMKTVRLARKSKMLHIEAPGCIVNITPGLTDVNGRMICRVDVNANGDRYAGDPQWWVEGEAGNRGLGLRVIQTDTPAAPESTALADTLHRVLTDIRAYDEELNDPGGNGGVDDAKCPDGDDYNRLMELLAPLYALNGIAAP